MIPFQTVTGRAYPLGLANVDTDVIVPGRFLTTVTRTGLGKGAFETIRAQPGNVFADPACAGAPILLAGANFGCGSSREHAAWALADMGIRAVIAPSFSDIFTGNAFKNGIAPIVLPQEAVDRLLVAACSTGLTIDLAGQNVTTGAGDSFSFAIDAFRKHCLLNGLDEIGITLTLAAHIDAFEAQQNAAAPWVPGAAKVAA